MGNLRYKKPFQRAALGITFTINTGTFLAFFKKVPCPGGVGVSFPTARAEAFFLGRSHVRLHIIQGIIKENSNFMGEGSPLCDLH